MLSLFHKISRREYSAKIKLCVFLLLWVTWAMGICMAQEPIPPLLQGQEQQNPNKNEDQEQPAEQEPTTVEVDQNEPIRSLGAQTFLDDVFENMRNRWGMSVSAGQGYTTDFNLSSAGQQGSMFTSVIPRMFLNFGRRRSMLHIDVGGGYRHYNGKSRDSDTWDYFGNALYSKEISRHTSFSLSNQFKSSYNDSWSFVSLYSPISYDPNFSNEIILNRQRITRNSLATRLSYEATRRITIDLFADYNRYRYTRHTLINSDAFEAGLGVSFRLKKWLSFNSSYSTYLNSVSDNYSDARIQRLQVGGFDFHPTRSWKIWANGGVDYASYRGGSHFDGDLNAGIAYSTRNFTYNTTFQHGFTSAIGISSLMNSDVVGFLLGYRISKWARIHGESYYYRNSEQSGFGVLKSFSSGGGLNLMLSRNFFISSRAFIQAQSSRNFSVAGLGIRRFTVNVGLQYVFPSRKLNKNIPQIWGVQ
jgi:hypothetical protein